MTNRGNERIHIDPSWLSTAEAINALPESLRRYIHDLETNTDHAGILRENMILRAERDELVAKKVTELAGKNQRG